MRRFQWCLIPGLIVCAVALLLLSACSNQEEAQPVAQSKVTVEQTAKYVNQIHQDLVQVAKAALQYKEEKGEDPPNGRVLKSYLPTWPKPPEEVRDPSYTFEWNYFVTGTLDDMGGPTTDPDVVVCLEGITEQTCYSFNRIYGGLDGKAWDFLGKQERPADTESWCENGGNPYRIIHVVSLR